VELLDVTDTAPVVVTFDEPSAPGEALEAVDDLESRLAKEVVARPAICASMKWPAASFVSLLDLSTGTRPRSDTLSIAEWLSGAYRSCESWRPAFL
jgi:hypothetical protein